jgi:hypothetical protein
MQKVYSLSKVVLSLSLMGVLLGCAHSENAPVYGVQSDAVSQAACQDNAYLKRYGCSLQRVEQAAQTNEPDAEYALGYMYYNGIGTVKDTDTATVWIERAAQQGQPLAISALKTMRHAQFPAMGQVNVGDQAATEKSQQQQSAPAIHHPVGMTQKPMSKKASAQNTDQDDLDLNLLRGSAQPHVQVRSSQQQHSRPGQPMHSVDQSAQKSSQAATVKSAWQKPVHSMGNLKNMPANHFTVQLFASPNLQNVRNLEENLQHDVPMAIASMKRAQTTWYVLLAGDFITRQAATAYVSTLPASIKAAKPWIRNFGSLE